MNKVYSSPFATITQVSDSTIRNHESQVAGHTNGPLVKALGPFERPSDN